MEVVIPVQNMDFDFNSARSSPCVSPPSTPKPFGDYYFSAPTSPTRLSQFYREFDDLLIMNTSSRTKISNWEERSSSKPSNSKNEDEFAFDFSEDLEKASLSAEELFDGGVIRPMKVPEQKRPISHSKRIIRNVLSPRQKKETDPLERSDENTSKKTPNHERGRDRSSVSSTSSLSRRGTRSLSPFRESQYPWEEREEELLHQNAKQSSTNSKSSSSANATSDLSRSSSKGCRKWSLMDFFLFRSASEGRAADKDPLRKYTALLRKHEDAKNSSFRASESFSHGSNSRRNRRVSAHELHYTENRAVSENLKKKTFLPYKQGILGRLAFNPAVHALANGFGFSRK